MSHNSLKGNLLVASPHLGDPNFTRTVVLMVEHTPDDALGLVLNRPSDFTIDQVWEQLTGNPTECLEPIFVGGPCEGPLMAVHTEDVDELSPLEESPPTQILPGLWFTAHKDHLRELVETGTRSFRLFSGYSGWGAGQLDAEMEAGGWLTTPAQAKYVFLATHDELWKAVAQDIGDDILRADPRIRDLPGDPSLN